MTLANFLDPLSSTKLVLMDRFLNEMIELYNSNKFPKVLLLNGQKGIGKFTLVFHFLNYIFTKEENKPYNLKDKIINKDSFFYNQILNKTNQDVMLLRAEENKNIKIDDIRNLKTTLSRSSLSNKPRFVVIDEVEFINENSTNALLKSLEEPSDNNFFILINNQQAELIKTISSRCLKSNIFLNSQETKTIINYLLEYNNIKDLIDSNNYLTPGLFIQFNEIYSKLNITKEDKIQSKIRKLLNGYNKNKNKVSINLTLFLIDQYFLKLAQANEKRIDLLLCLKTDINKNINDFIHYNLNINSVLNSIEIKLNNV
jgi:DNA polymerase III subunit delta'